MEPPIPSPGYSKFCSHFPSQTLKTVVSEEVTEVVVLREDVSVVVEDTDEVTEEVVLSEDVKVVVVVIEEVIVVVVLIDEVNVEVVVLEVVAVDVVTEVVVVWVVEHEKSRPGQHRLPQFSVHEHTSGIPSGAINIILPPV